MAGLKLIEDGRGEAGEAAGEDWVCPLKCKLIPPCVCPVPTARKYATLNGTQGIKALLGMDCGRSLIERSFKVTVTVGGRII